ncbi:sulfotransferase family 2 domain-containing protein [Paracoccus sp. MBLB3053]|uniref:Sulfotransferase family 2 domain-containing protein n=1 Tax=Paracoccus aurantius TaxID=3073814 RepID=A0ABU2HU54_9RHOB|nr:sulfotransferase family 2 domain-containing protein [Paracoccus sp. MBLB3053]MDS9468581.1 sulfotransferase family 2 domain-containing protein [Paracoccus sp. MBLB3053]
MSTFNTLKAHGVERFAGKISQSDAIWVFHHIPKTAGSSLTHELRQVLPPYRNIFADHRPGVASRADSLMDAVDAFLTDYPTYKYRSASGHLRRPHLNRILETLPEARLITFLRNPAERLISDYRYAKTPKHPTHVEFSEKFPTLDDYIDHPQSQNKMWAFVSSQNADADEKMMRSVFNRYAFIGTLETLADDFSFFTSLFGCPKAMQAKVNITANQKDNKVEIDATTLQKIQSLNMKDFALYDLVTETLAERRSEMNDFIRSKRELWLGIAAE